MERISVDLGQFVLTGEPVAIMGTGRTRPWARPAQASRFCTSSFARTGRPSIQALGGLTQARRFADDAQGFLVLLGALAGAALTLVLSQPRAVFIGAAAKAAASDTYRQLNLFGDVFERVRSDYVESPTTAS